MIRIVTKIKLTGPWAMPYPSKKFRQNPFTTVSVIRRTDRQTGEHTDRQTNRQTYRSENITSSGRGNKPTLCCSNLLCFLVVTFSPTHWRSHWGYRRSPDTPKIQVGGVRHPKKGGTSDVLASKRMWESPISRQLLNAVKDA